MSRPQDHPSLRGGALASFEAALRRRFRRWECRLRDRFAPPRRPALPPAPERLVFVCFGNICRSAYAAARCAELLPECSVASAGLHATAGAAPPRAAVAAARERGLDLSAHRATPLGALPDSTGTIYFVMEPWQRRAVRRRRGDARRRIHLLGALASPPVVAIADPYGGPPERFAAAFALIDDATRRLVEAVRAARGRSAR